MPDSPRGSISPQASGELIRPRSSMLYQEHFMVQTPEAAASALQQAFKL